MFERIKSILVIFGLALILLGLGAASSQPSNPIPLSDLMNRGIDGTLGEPLGKIIVIHGKAVDGGTLNLKDGVGETYLLVDHAADHPIQPPQLIRLVIHQFAKSKPTLPNANQIVSLTGFETGGYAGAPPGQWDFTELYQERDYTFETHFEVLK